MLKWMKSNWKAITLFIIIFIIAIPLAINWAFKQCWGISWLEAEWSADTALTFYGSIIAACIAVYGVFLTIQYSQENYKEDVRNRTLPFITIDILKSKTRYNLFPSKTLTDVEEEPLGYVEYKIQDYYCILQNGNIRYMTGLTKQQQQILEQGGIRTIKNGFVYSSVTGNILCIPIEIENIGNGTAVGFRYGINRINIPEDERKFLHSMSLKPNQPILFHIFSEDCGKNSINLGKYELAFHYEDILKNQYAQKFNIEIYFDSDKKRPVAAVDMNNKQEFCGGDH